MSEKFRRCRAIGFHLDGHDYADAVELCAFVGTVGERAADWIFGWVKQYPRERVRLLRHQLADVVEPYLRENELHADVQDGIAVLEAMRRGGWVKGKLPPFVRRSVQAVAHDIGPAAAARLLGINLYTMKDIVYGKTRKNNENSLRATDWIA